jgi:hypothetical protein
MAEREESVGGPGASVGERVLVAAAEAVKAGEGPLTATELAARAGVSDATVGGFRAHLARLYPGLLRDAREMVLAAADAAVGAGEGPLTVTELAARAQVSETTVGRFRAELERLYPGLLGAASARVFAAAAAAVKAGEGPLTVTELAARAHVGNATVGRFRAQLERRHPGFLRDARALVLVAAAAAVKAGEGDLTASALAARAGVSKATVGGLRAELGRLYPGLLRDPRARVFAAAAAAVAAGEGSLTATELAARADVSDTTVGGLRVELMRRYPGLLDGASARVLAAAAAAVTAREGSLTVTELAARAHVSKDTVRGSRAELETLYPGLLRSRRAY